MNKPEPSRDNKQQAELVRLVGIKATRKLKAKRSNASVWFGLGMMGLIGWSVAVPTLLGAALGIYLDNRYHDGHSWTLALLLAGLTLGCFTAWQWVAKEGQAIHKDNEEENE
jgi:ATP synthase protein I